MLAQEPSIDAAAVEGVLAGQSPNPLPTLVGLHTHRALFDRGVRRRTDNSRRAAREQRIHRARSCPPSVRVQLCCREPFRQFVHRVRVRSLFSEKPPLSHTVEGGENLNSGPSRASTHYHDGAMLSCAAHCAHQPQWKTHTWQSLAAFTRVAQSATRSPCVHSIRPTSTRVTVTALSAATGCASATAYVPCLRPPIPRPRHQVEVIMLTNST